MAGISMCAFMGSILPLALVGSCDDDGVVATARLSLLSSLSLSSSSSARFLVFPPRQASVILKSQPLRKWQVALCFNEEVRRVLWWTKAARKTLQACREVLSVPSFRFTSSTHFFFPPPSPSPPPPPPQRTFLPATPHPMMDPSTPRSIQPLHLKPRPRHIIHERKRKIKPNQRKRTRAVDLLLHCVYHSFSRTASASIAPSAPRTQVCASFSWSSASSTSGPMARSPPPPTTW